MYKPKSVKSYNRGTYLLSPSEVELVKNALKCAAEFCFCNEYFDKEQEFIYFFNKLQSEVVPGN